MQKFKELYKFSFQKEEEVPEIIESTNESGEKVTVTKIIKKDKDFEFCLQKPSRSIIDEAELFYNVTVSKGIQAGLMSAALLAKRLTNDGGVLSEKEKEEWGNKFVDRVKKELALQKLGQKERDAKEETEYDELLKDVAILTRDMQEFEIRQQSLFDVTAEARARTRTIMWWLFFLLYAKDSKGEWQPFFAGKTLEEKQWAYDDLDDEDLFPTEEIRKFNAKIVSHAVQAITLWYYGKVTKQEEFKQAFENHLRETPVIDEKAKDAQEVTV